MSKHRLRRAAIGAAAVVAAGTTVAGAAPIVAPPDLIPQTSIRQFGQIEVWLDENGRDVWFAERGRETKLQDSDVGVSELRNLLQGTTGTNRRVVLERLILVGGGGCAFNWKDPNSKEAAKPNPATGQIAGDAPQPKATVRPKRQKHQQPKQD